MILYIVADLLHFIKIVIICDWIIKFEKRLWITPTVDTILLSVIFGVFSVVTYYVENPIVKTMEMVMFIEIMLCITYKERIKEILVMGFFLIFELTIIDHMALIISEILFTVMRFPQEGVIKVGGALISLVLCFVLGNTSKKRFSQGIKSIGIWGFLLFTILALMDAVVLVGITEYIKKGVIENVKSFFVGAYIFAGIGILIQLGTVIVLLMQNGVYKEKEEMVHKFLKAQNAHYRYLEKKEKETKKFRHDIHNHMQVLYSFSQEKNYEKLDEYLSVMNQKTNSFFRGITVRNGIVDAILNYYRDMADEKGITMTISGTFPQNSNVEDYDLCTIFSNILSNALEAAEKTEEKKIIISCRHQKNKEIIIIKNSWLEKNEKILSTSKEDKDAHGFGLENVRDAVEKYNGFLLISVEEGMFVLKIVLSGTEV